MGRGWKRAGKYAQEPRQSFTRQVFFKDAKQMLYLGKEQSKTFDAAVVDYNVFLTNFKVVFCLDRTCFQKF